MQNCDRHWYDRLFGWCYRWLPIFFGCHCKAARSFYYHGKKFPICARCTGQLIGMVMAIIFYKLICPFSIIVLIGLLLPLIIDGTIQKLTAYESTNVRRLWTGVLFGYSLLTLFFHSVVATFCYGYEIGVMLR